MDPGLGFGGWYGFCLVGRNSGFFQGHSDIPYSDNFAGLKKQEEILLLSSFLSGIIWMREPVFLDSKNVDVRLAFLSGPDEIEIRKRHKIFQLEPKR